MSNSIYDDYIKNFNANLLDCKQIGKGHNGIVYMLPNGKVIKVCYDEESCRKEYNILHKIKKSRYFPRVYGMSGNYMVRDYVEGTILSHYIYQNGLSEELAYKIIKLLEEFKRLRFSKEDLRCKDIIVMESGELMVIDPKKFYSKERNFPRHLAKGLYRLGVLEDFLRVVKKRRRRMYKRWNGKVEEYIQERYGEIE